MSVTYIDPAAFLYQLNEHRLRIGQRFLINSGYLTDLTHKQMRRFINNEAVFSLQSTVVNRRKATYVLRRLEEILFRCSLSRSVLENLFEDAECKKLLEGEFNIVGITLCEFGTYAYLYCIVGLTL
jgi:hypothetical protein